MKVKMISDFFLQTLHKYGVVSLSTAIREAHIGE